MSNELRSRFYEETDGPMLADCHTGGECFTEKYVEWLEKQLLDTKGEPSAECKHNWVDTTNKVVSGTDICLKCGITRVQE